MIAVRSAEIQVDMPSRGIAAARKRSVGRYRPVSWIFARQAVQESVTTKLRIDASASVIWKELLFYEEVPEKAPFLLRSLLPQPIRTEGEKRQIGATVRCVYSSGDLVKRVTRVEAPNLLRFEVVEQNLGIEHCVRTLSGSYQIQNCGDASTIFLTTHYEGYLHPRLLWRGLEVVLVRQLHGQILRGICAAVLPESAMMRSTVTGLRNSERTDAEGL